MENNTVVKKENAVVVANILNGLRNYLFSTKEIKELAATRATICGNCDKLKKSIVTLPESLKEIQSFKCGMCSCSLTLKIRSEKESCPINKW